MADSLKERLRQIGSRVGMKNRARDTATGAEAADRIEKLEEENSVLFVANVRLNSRADLDGDHYRDRIKQLEAALEDMAQYVSRGDWHYLKPETIAALEKKDEA